MIKRTLDISDGPTYLSIADDQLVLKREGAEIGRVPCEDIGLLLVEHRATTYSHPALVRLMRHGAAVVLCGEDHLPAGLLLPMDGNALQTERLRAQVAAKLPLRKRLWQQIVRRKIRGQAMNLERKHGPAHPAVLRLRVLADETKSGDPSNCEGHAGRFYWPALLGEEFRRSREGAPPNNLLNYGYMVMRAAVARALVGAGLNPAFGLHHSNRSNAFCLADDLVETLRPRVDAVVAGLVGQGNIEIDRAAKSALLGLLSAEVNIAGQSGPLLVGLQRLTASLVKCYEGVNDALDLPDIE
jgi:CRISP-associated protein Cas1